MEIRVTITPFAQGARTLCPACPLGRGLAVRAVARPGNPLIGKRARWIALGRMAMERGIPDAGDEIDLEGLDPKGTVQ